MAFLKLEDVLRDPDEPGPSLPWTQLGTFAFWSGWIVIAIAALFLFIDNDTKSWPTTDGVVRTAGVARSGREVPFAYDYVVGKIRYRGHRITPGQDRAIGIFNPDAADPQDVARRYPPGTAVTVYYDPADPDDSVLEPGVSLFTICAWALGIFLVVLGFIVYVKRPFREIDTQEAWEHHSKPYG